MRILFIAELKETDICGVTTHIKNLMLGLNELGHKTDFISMSSVPTLLIKLCISLPTRLMGIFSLDFRWMWPFIFMQSYLSLYLIYKQIFNRYDVINVQGTFSLNSTYFLRKIFKKPVVLTEHSYRSGLIEGRGITKNGFTENFLISQEKKALHNADLIVPVDSRIRDYLISEYGGDPRKIKVKINFVNVNEFIPRDGKKRFQKQFGIPDKKLVVLCPRRLDDPKNGVKYGALAAIYLIKKFGNNFIVVITGGGGRDEEFRKIVKENEIEENILILEAIPHNQMKYLYNASDITIIPSINFFGLEEATSLSALESMSSGVPVIASDIGGLKEIINDNETGFLVEEKNPLTLANKSIEVYENDNTLITRNAREWVIEKASHIKRAKEFLDLYEIVILNKNKR